MSTEKISLLRQEDFPLAARRNPLEARAIGLSPQEKKLLSNILFWTKN